MKKGRNRACLFFFKTQCFFQKQIEVCLFLHSRVGGIKTVELEEEMRILYVALTRAQQQMHIVDCIKSMEDYEEGCTTASVYERNGYNVPYKEARDNAPAA